MSTSEVTLKNGKTAPDVAVNAIMISLRRLLDDGYGIALYELACLCRDPGHDLFGNTAEVLRSRSLIDLSYQPHDMVRDIVLSALTGEGFDLGLGSPLA